MIGNVCRLDMEAEIDLTLNTLFTKIEALCTQRKAVSAQVLWVSETELSSYIPYSIREIKKMRKEGKLKAYPDIRGGKRVNYNLMEVSNLIQGAKGNHLLQFDPHDVKIFL